MSRTSARAARSTSPAPGPPYPLEITKSGASGGHDHVRPLEQAGHAERAGRTRSTSTSCRAAASRAGSAICLCAPDPGQARSMRASNPRLTRETNLRPDKDARVLSERCNPSKPAAEPTPSVGALAHAERPGQRSTGSVVSCVDWSPWATGTAVGHPQAVDPTGLDQASLPSARAGADGRCSVVAAVATALIAGRLG